MAIQDTDYFLIEGNDGPKRIQASVLRDGLTTTYADYYMLANKPDWSSCKFKCIDLMDKLPDPSIDPNPYYLLVNRVDGDNWLPRKVKSNIVRGYFSTAFSVIWSDYFGSSSQLWPGSVVGMGRAEQGPEGFDGDLTTAVAENSCRAYGEGFTGSQFVPPATIPCAEAQVHFFTDFKSPRTAYWKINNIDISGPIPAVENQIDIIDIDVSAQGGLVNLFWTNNSGITYPYFPEGVGMVGVKVDGVTLIDGQPMPVSVETEYLRRLTAKNSAIEAAIQSGYDNEKALALGWIAHDRIVDDWCLSEGHIDTNEFNNRRAALLTKEASIDVGTYQLDSAGRLI